MVHDKRLLPACITARSQLEVELAVIGRVKQLNSLSRLLSVLLLEHNVFSELTIGKSGRTRKPTRGSGRFDRRWSEVICKDPDSVPFAAGRSNVMGLT
jgi:hypothetical protein